MNTRLLRISDMKTAIQRSDLDLWMSGFFLCLWRFEKICQVYGKTVAARLYEDDTRDRYIHIYFNVAKQAAERIRFEQTLDKMKLKLDKGLQQPSTWTKPYHDLFELKYDRKGNFIAYAERKDVIKKQLELCGYFCVATSNKMTAAEALILYKGKRKINCR